MSITVTCIRLKKAIDRLEQLACKEACKECPSELGDDIFIVLKALYTSIDFIRKVRRRIEKMNKKRS